jgi:hypothetical protein
MPPTQASLRHVKAKGLLAFQRFSRASQLVEAAGNLRLWAAQPLALAHLYAWRGDGLQALFHLFWCRWRDRAQGRVRLRAFLAAHLRRAAALQMELCFKAWHKAAAAVRDAREEREAAAEEAAEGEGGEAEAADATGRRRGSQGSADGAKAGFPDGTSSPDLQAALQFAATLPGGASNSGGGRDAQPASGGEPEDSESSFSSSTNSSSTDDTGSISSTGASPPHPPEPAADRTSRRRKTHACLSDFPESYLPWGAPLPASAVLAPRGLQRAPAVRVAKMARDLREMEGAFMPRDAEGGAAGGSAVAAAAFVKAGAGAGLRAAVAARPRAELVRMVGG